MKEYETICVLQPDVQGDKLKSLEDKIKKIFTQHKVKEVSKKDWGLRKLAYPVKNYKTGHYLQWVYQAPSELIEDLEKNLGYEESVLRFLTIKFTKHSFKNALVEPDGFHVSEY